jgi:hypothetical protein
MLPCSPPSTQNKNFTAMETSLISHIVSNHLQIRIEEKHYLKEKVVTD